MFGGQGELLATTTHVEIGVAPAVEFARAPECLSRTCAAGVFAGVVNEEDGQLELPLELAQEGEQGVVFVDSMKTDFAIGMVIEHGLSELICWSA